MLLILARHGNTFGPEDTPVWVGAHEDLPLVEKGLEQSRAMGEALRSLNQLPDRILAGPLKRTRHGARLVGEVCGFTGEVEIDERLKEIDYGVWGGKTDAEITESWGESAIADWRDRSIPPTGAGWSPTVETLKSNARSVLDSVSRDRSEDTVVFILTSNGVLRYFHELLAGQDAPTEDAKVKTGHMGAVRITADSRELLGWNLSPDAFVEALRS
jgi:probable phosphoglycerate mutase